jgi:hypothetical protein
MLGLHGNHNVLLIVIHRAMSAQLRQCSNNTASNQNIIFNDFVFLLGFVKCFWMYHISKYMHFLISKFILKLGNHSFYDSDSSVILLFVDNAVGDTGSSCTSKSKQAHNSFLDEWLSRALSVGQHEIHWFTCSTIRCSWFLQLSHVLGYIHWHLMWPEVIFTITYAPHARKCLLSC